MNQTTNDWMSHTLMLQYLYLYELNWSYRSQSNWPYIKNSFDSIHIKFQTAEASWTQTRLNQVSMNDCFSIQILVGRSSASSDRRSSPWKASLVRTLWFSGHIFPFPSRMTPGVQRLFVKHWDVWSHRTNTAAARLTADVRNIQEGEWTEEKMTFISLICI